MSSAASMASSSSFTGSVQPSFMDRARGMIYGLMIGDALGVPLEFSRAKPKLEYTGIINTEHAQTIQWQWAKTTIPPASTSDDTAMSLALFEALLDNDLKYDSERVALAYMKFANTIETGLGRNTRRLFHGVKTYRGYLNRWARFEDELKECESNGSLMRASPLVFAIPGDEKDENSDDEDAKDDYALTNPNSVNQHATGIYRSVLEFIYSGTDKDEIAIWLAMVAVDSDAPESVKEAILDALKRDAKRDLSGRTKGWVCHCLFAALHAFLYHDTMEAAMAWIVTQPNTDADTNAAVAGALFGAYLGLNGLKREEKTTKNITIIETVTPEGKRAMTLLDRLAKTRAAK
jgi:ADP-ribosyl-[dinitrogen reductase] hydrolase